MVGNTEENVVPFESSRNPEAGEKRELLTILFTDLVDSTKLQSDFGDAEAARLTELHATIVRTGLKDHNAQEIKWAGDSCLASFTKPSDAIEFSVSMLAAHRRSRETEPHLPKVRVGMHLGEVVIQSMVVDGKITEDVFGLQVSNASRIMSLARGDQIFCSRPVFDSARFSLRGRSRFPGCTELSWLAHGLFDLKGSPEPVEICEVGEKSIAPLKAPESNEKCKRVSAVATTSELPAESRSYKWLARLSVLTAVVAVVTAIYIGNSDRSQLNFDNTHRMDWVD